MPANTITLSGNLVADPELKYIPSGKSVASFRIANTPRHLDRATNEWKDGETLWMSCSIWDKPAENVAESLKKGDTVIVTGKLAQRSYETGEGEKRTVYEIKCDEVSVSLRNASARISKADRSGSSQGYGGASQAAGGQSRPAEDPWATPLGQPADGIAEPPF
jgi:single-strand DNA-binding protein